MRRTPPSGGNRASALSPRVPTRPSRPDRISIRVDSWLTPALFWPVRPAIDEVRWTITPEAEGEHHA